MHPELSYSRKTSVQILMTPTVHISKIETTKFRGMFTVLVEVIFLVKSAK